VQRNGWVSRSIVNLAFADCITPVVTARDTVRAPFAPAFITEHQADVDELQAALQDYLTAVYNQH
jgi:hypothetical protein